jgi:hypothetical protein
MAGWEEELTIILHELGVKFEDSNSNDEPWMSDLNMMHREVDAIVTQVILLMQRGDLDVSLKEDIMIVLRALRHLANTMQQTVSADHAYLEAVSAMLHFCRLVLQLSEVATED